MLPLRHIFFFGKQKTKESFKSIETDLKDLISLSEFYQVTDSLIKDKLILGIRKKYLRDRLFFLNT